MLMKTVMAIQTSGKGPWCHTRHSGLGPQTGREERTGHFGQRVCPGPLRSSGTPWPAARGPATLCLWGLGQRALRCCTKPGRVTRMESVCPTGGSEAPAQAQSRPPAE